MDGVRPVKVWLRAVSAFDTHAPVPMRTSHPVAGSPAVACGVQVRVAVVAVAVALEVGRPGTMVSVATSIPAAVPLPAVLRPRTEKA